MTKCIYPIIQTFWLKFHICSRYDHFAVLCELLPAAIPSLVLNLAVVSAGAHTVDASKKANRLLLCDAAVELMSPEALARNSNQVNSACSTTCNQMGLEVLEGLRVSQSKPCPLSRKINKRIIAHPVTLTLVNTVSSLLLPPQWEMYRCRYPGSSFLGALASYDMTRKEVEAAEEKVGQQFAI